MPKQQTSRTSVLTQARPLCTAVKGCERRAGISSYKLPSGRRCRICPMHLQRVIRTGELGGPGTKTPANSEIKGKAMREKLLAELRRLRACAGTEWRVVSEGRASCLVVGVTRRQAPEQSTAGTLRAMERRGWLRIGAWREDGARLAEILAAGVKALEA